MASIITFYTNAELFDISSKKNIEKLSNLLYRAYPFAYELFRRQIVYSTNSPDFQEPIQYKGLRLWNIH